MGHRHRHLKNQSALGAFDDVSLINLRIGVSRSQATDKKKFTAIHRPRRRIIDAQFRQGLTAGAKIHRRLEGIGDDFFREILIFANTPEKEIKELLMRLRDPQLLLQYGRWI